MLNFLNKIISLSLRLTVFLTPLFFLPFTFEFYNFNKLNLLFVLVSAALLAWLGKSVLFKKSLRFQKTPLNWPIFLLLGAGFFSAVFSADRWNSFFGHYGFSSGGFLQIFFLAAFVFLLLNNRLKSLRPENLLRLFLWSGFLAALVSALSFLASRFNWGFLDGLPSVLKSGFFTPLGASFESAAVFLACLSAASLSLFYFGLKDFHRLRPSLVFTRFFTGLNLLLCFFVIFFSRSSTAWLVLAASAFLLVLGVFMTRVLYEKAKAGENQNRFQMPALAMAVFVLSVFFLFSPAILSGFFQERLVPQEAVLPPDWSWAFSLNHLSKDPFLGAGPGNFAAVFEQSRPIAFNNSSLWLTSFDRAGSHLAEMLSTWGLVGFSSYLLFLFFYIFVSLRLFGRFYRAGKKHCLFPFFVWGSLLIAQVFFYQNLALAFAFWFVTALSLLFWQNGPLKKAFAVQIFDFSKKPEWGALLAGGFLILALSWAGSLVFLGRFYLAETAYAGLLKNTGQDLAVKLKTADRAAALNPLLPQYQIGRSRFYLLAAETELPEAGRSQEKTDLLGDRLDKAVKSAKAAVDLSPESAQAWENLGDIYARIKGSVQGGDLWSQEAFKKASEISPQNPTLAIKAGRAFLSEIAGNEFAKDSGQLKEAERFFQKALALKKDWAETLIYQAMVLELQEKPSEAINLLRQTIEKNPNHIEVYFQLGRIHFNQNQVALAIQSFQKAIELSPNHSNARYSLAVALKVQGQNALALEQFKKVLELNPENKDVLGKIRELEN